MHERTLSRYAIERLLYRLGESTVRTRCVLKGASLLSVWLQEPYRSTRDIDVLAFGASDEGAIRGLIESICGVACPEDAVQFDLKSLIVEDIRVEGEHVGKRARMRAFLGKSRVLVQLDFGFGDALAAEPENVSFPTILPTLPAPQVLAYSRESSLSEKFEAMLTLGYRNSRMKDFHDVWALTGTFQFRGAAVRSSVAACLSRRKVSIAGHVADALTMKYYEDAAMQARWISYATGSSVIVAPPTQFEIVGERVMKFFGPVFASLVDQSLFEFHWDPGGPWH